MFHATSSFAPSLPLLPSYPRHLAPSRSSSPGYSHSHKKSRPSQLAQINSNHGYIHGSTHSYNYNSPFFAPPTPDASDTDADDGLMSHSMYSDRDYRSSLVTSRKRNHSDYDDDSERSLRRDRGGKRRIIDVVGVTLGGVLRGAWQMLRTPFVAHPAPAPPVTVEHLQPPPPQPSYAPGGWMASPPSTAGSQASTAGSTAYFDAAETSTSTAPLDTAVGAQWIMVSPRSTPSPTTTRSTRSFSNASSRGRRPVVASKKRGLKPLGGVAGSPGKRHRKTGSGGRAAWADDEEEMDDDMKRFNERLKAMIREGREALGAKVEVVYDEDEDICMEGF